MRQRGDYHWTIEKKDGQYRALVFERAGNKMVTVAQSEFFADKAQAAEDAESIIDTAMLARDYD